MFKIVDSFRMENEHEIINSKLIEIVSNNEDEIELFLSKSHYKALTYLDKRIDTKKFMNLYNIRKKSKIRNLLQYLIGFVQDVYIYIRSEKVLYLTINPFSLLFVNILNLFLKKKILFVCHGELEIISSKGWKSFSMSMLPFALIFKLAFNFRIDDYITFILLGENIKKNVFAVSSRYKNYNFITIEHPYVFTDRFINADVKYPLIIGTLGVNTYEKNSHYLLKFTESIKLSILKGEIEVYTTGPLKIDVSKSENSSLINFKNNSSTMLSRNEYDNLVNQLDIVLFFYSLKSYKFTASGAFFDALNYRKPIIAVKNSFFEYYFEKYGDMGVLCENLDEMKYIIDNIDSFKFNYKFFVLNIEKAIKDLIENNANIKL